MEDNFQPSSTSARPESFDLKENYLELQRVFISVLAGLVILSAGLAYFFYFQMSMTKKELEVSGPVINEMVSNYEKMEDPQIKNFINSLVNYSKTHSDFLPILAKYNVTPSGRTNTIPLVPKK